MWLNKMKYTYGYTVWDFVDSFKNWTAERRKELVCCFFVLGSLHRLNPPPWVIERSYRRTHFFMQSYIYSLKHGSPSPRWSVIRNSTAYRLSTILLSALWGPWSLFQVAMIKRVFSLHFLVFCDGCFFSSLSFFDTDSSTAASRNLGSRRSWDSSLIASLFWVLMVVLFICWAVLRLADRRLKETWQLVVRQFSDCVLLWLPATRFSTGWVSRPQPVWFIPSCVLCVMDPVPHAQCALHSSHCCSRP